MDHENAISPEEAGKTEREITEMEKLNRTYDELVARLAGVTQRLNSVANKLRGPQEATEEPQETIKPNKLGELNYYRDLNKAMGTLVVNAGYLVDELEHLI